MEKYSTHKSVSLKLITKEIYAFRIFFLEKLDPTYRYV